MGGDRKLLIDLDAAVRQQGWSARCSYYNHRGNDGINDLRERAAFGVFCRHCAEGTCIRACPQEALKRGEDGIVRRSTMLCVKCNSCVIACPFGTLMEELIPFATSRCDACASRLAEGEVPLCVSSVSDGSLQYGQIAEDPSRDIYALNDRVLVRTSMWKREAGKGQRE
jgi:formate dehydrogenase iron-sulfur subunit